MTHFQRTIFSCKLIEKLKFHLHKPLQVYHGEIQVLFQIKMIKDVENNKITKTFQFKRHSNDNRP